MKFPEDGEIPNSSLQSLESLLPDREDVIIPDNADECDLIRIDPEEQRRQYRVSTEFFLMLLRAGESETSVEASVSSFSNTTRHHIAT